MKGVKSFDIAKDHFLLVFQRLRKFGRGLESHHVALTIGDTYVTHTPPTHTYMYVQCIPDHTVVRVVMLQVVEGVSP